MAEFSKPSERNELDSYPFGRTEYRNYDPDQIQSPEDVADLMSWLSELNRDQGEVVAANVFADCNNLVRETLVEIEDEASVQDESDQE